MEYLISGIWLFLECVSFIFFAAAFLEYRTTKQRSMLITLLICGISFVLTNSSLPSNIKQFGTAIMSITLIVCLFKGQWAQIILIGILSYILIAVIDSVTLFGTASILQISLERLIWRKTTYVVVATAGKLISIFFAWIVMRLHPFKKTHRMEPKWFALISIFPLVSLVMMLSLFLVCRNQEDLTSPVVLFCAFLGVANFAIVYVIVSIEKDTVVKQMNRMLAQQTEIQTASILALEKAYRIQRKSSHDFQNHLCTISELLDNRQYDASQKYIHELVQTQTSRVLIVNSHHPIVDAILNQKYQLAHEVGIDMHFHINDLSRIHLGASELVVLLCNLIDNAIEACQKLEQSRQILCTLTHNDTILLSIRNTSMPVEITDGGLHTTKEKPHEHGYGLTGACRVLDALGAEYTFEYNNGWFQFTAEIPLASTH